MLFCLDLGWDWDRDIYPSMQSWFSICSHLEQMSSVKDNR